MYEKGEISEEQINSLIAIRNLTDEEWLQIKNDYLEGNIKKEEFEQIKQIREMPEDWTTFENRVKGLGYGAVNGLWEGLQWSVGGKMNDWVFKGSKIVTSATRIGVDTAFNAMDTPFRTLSYAACTDGDVGAAWVEQGGWSSVLTNVGVGLIGSTGGEIFDSVKVKLQSKANVSKFNSPGTTLDLDKYLTNLQYYSSKGISIEEYLLNNGIKLSQADTKLAAADIFGDSKLYMLETAENVLKSGNLSIIKQQELANILTQYSSSRVGNLDLITMANELSPYLSGDQMQHMMDLANTGVADTRGYTDEQLAAIFNYTACGGFEINSWLNDINLPGSNRKARDEFRKVSNIQDAISGYGPNRVFPSSQGDILDCLDSVISSTNYADAIVTYRGVRELYDVHTKIDCLSLKVGDSFGSSGYQSSSIVFENCYGYSNPDTNIILKIIVPPNSGTAAYIENVTGVANYGQMEMLIKRNAIMTVVGDLEFVSIKGINKTIIPVIVQ